MTPQASSGARTRARELVLQALYQKQIAGHDCDELLSQFKEQSAYQRVDQTFFGELLAEICAGQAELEAAISGVIDRPLDQLDPVELSILLIGIFELQQRVDIPYRVVINESVNLAKRFGAIDGHKYINACLDNAAQGLRETEISG
ncbi:MAG: transcription antitermination factor NusB [Gammaproteobacteria bacterium]|nr:transcription antitermination factor NusB [Gammaproteobacteria bacterium]